MRVARTIGVRTSDASATTATSEIGGAAAQAPSDRGRAVDLRDIDTGQRPRRLARQRGIDRAVLVGLQRRRPARQRHDRRTRGRRSRCRFPPGSPPPPPLPERDHSLAVGSDGKLYAWGHNTNGQLGNGTVTSSTTPIVVSMPAGVTATAVAAGDAHSVALGSNGSVYDWGYNGFGQLGNNTTTDAHTPVKVTLPGRGDARRRGRRPVHDRGARRPTATCTPGATAPWASSANGKTVNEIDARSR